MPYITLQIKRELPVGITAKGVTTRLRTASIIAALCAVWQGGRHESRKSQTPGVPCSLSLHGDWGSVGYRGILIALGQCMGGVN